MKPELSELRKWLQTLLKKQNRARLALVLGCIAMALILLSELFPAKAPAAPQAVSPEEGTYKTQLEQQLKLFLQKGTCLLPFFRGTVCRERHLCGTNIDNRIGLFQHHGYRSFSPGFRAPLFRECLFQLRLRLR